MRKYHKYTDEERAFLLEVIPKMTYAEAASAFYDRFGMERSWEHIAGFASRNGITSGYNGIGNGRISWTPEMDEWLRMFLPGHSEAEVRAEFKGLFGYMPTTSQIANRRSKLGLFHGTNGGRFGSDTQPIEPGWNRGMPQSEWMSPESIERTKATRFKKGNVPHTHKPIGSEYVDKDGHVYIKVKDEQGAGRFGRDGNWQPRSRIAYERAHGSVPENSVIVHADRDPANDDPANLLAIDRSEYVMVTANGMYYYDMASLKLCVAIARLKRTQIDLKKRRKVR